MKNSKNSKKEKKKKSGHQGHNGGGNRTKVTAEKKAKFLENIIETGGNVTRAAELTNLARKTLYQHRDKDKKFAEAWDVAVDKGIDRLEDEAKRRAFEGVQEPVFYRGMCTDYVTRYSDTLLIFLLKGHREKYRERTEVNVGTNVYNLNDLLGGITNGDLKQRAKKLAGRTDRVHEEGSSRFRNNTVES